MFSNSPSDESGEFSNTFIEKTIVSVVKIFNKDINEEQMVKDLSLPVRKVAHFTEYFILGILLLLTFNSYGIKNWYIPIIICVLYALSDEVHQYFVPGRACRILDVLIDSTGGTVGVLFSRIVKKTLHK